MGYMLYLRLFNIQLHIISIFSCNFCLSFGIVEQDDSYLDSYISTIGVEFLQMEKGGGCGMSGRGREREVYISESSSSPQFQQQRPPLFPKETWTCFFLSAALPIFHQNHILNSSNFEHEMPGEVKRCSLFVRVVVPKRCCLSVRVVV
ncbi:uncharacterized protein LOC126621942 isoform X4 [Malus sylvestris]|uniref:uncharacterized protein LOC126621942 isoform X4 n=1 Tax=Malus sylvestris TaxID=3752 RepID=UPI0021AD49E5|nr:uncharacterized protein LOC126621942 isoform X4 [Malus sylvestris]